MIDEESRDSVKSYLQSGFDTVEGWCHQHVWQLLMPACDIISSVKPVGPIAEIGVHHGKFFISLVKASSSTNKHYAFDVFDDQFLNIDKSGRGNMQAFVSNLCSSSAPSGHLALIE